MAANENVLEGEDIRDLVVGGVQTQVLCDGRVK